MSSIDATTSESSPLSGFYSWTDTLKGVYYGPGSVKTALPKLLDVLGVKKALVVTGKSLHQKVCFTLVPQEYILTHCSDGCCQEGRSDLERAECIRCYFLRDRRAYPDRWDP